MIRRVNQFNENFRGFRLPMYEHMNRKQTKEINFWSDLQSIGQLKNNLPEVENETVENGKNNILFNFGKEFKRMAGKDLGQNLVLEKSIERKNVGIDYLVRNKIRAKSTEFNRR